MFVLMRDEYGHKRDGCMKERMRLLSGFILRPRRPVFERGRGTETIAENRGSKY